MSIILYRTWVISGIFWSMVLKFNTSNQTGGLKCARSISSRLLKFTPNTNKNYPLRDFGDERESSNRLPIGTLILQLFSNRQKLTSPLDTGGCKASSLLEYWLTCGPMCWEEVLIYWRLILAVCCNGDYQNCESNYRRWKDKMFGSKGWAICWICSKRVVSHFSTINPLSPPRLD